MFIMSMKLEKRKMLIWSIVIVALILLLIGLWMFLGGNSGKAAKSKTKMDAANNADRVAFLESFGWDVSDEPIEVCEIILPENFDEVYTKYNEIQKNQGMNLENFKGKRTKRWTYTVLNYPADDEEIHANVIIYDNKVIAGDICSVALGGFIHGFTPVEAGAFSETGLLASDLPTEINGIKKQDEQSITEDITNDQIPDELNKQVTDGDTADKADVVKESDSGSAIVDDVEQKARDEIEKSLEMLIKAAEDKNG